MQFRFVLLGALLLAPAVYAQNTTIPQIQGTTDESPLSGKAVVIEGIVTGDFQGANKFSGFYVQDPKGDGDPTTSDGVFVYQGTRGKAAETHVVPGDHVRVSGTVEEFKGQTQIGRLSAIQVLGKGEIPAPTAISLPLVAGTDFERYEGMLVTFSQPLVVTGQYGLGRYGQFVVAAGRQFNPTNVEPIEQVQAKTPTPFASLAVDDGSNAQNPTPTPYLDAQSTLRTGTTVRNLTGIINYGFDEYHLEPTIAPVFENTNPRTEAPGAVGGDLKVAAANVLNYFTTTKDQDSKSRGARDTTEFARQSSKIVAELRGLDADVVGLMEMQNNGPTAVNDLVTRLNASYGRNVYQAVADPKTGTGGDAIKVAMIYKPERLQPVGTSVSDPNTIYERYPLAQTFRDKKSGGVFTLVVNHLKSKRPGDDGAPGDPDRGEGAWTNLRVRQANALLGFINELKTRSGDSDVLAVGDFNSYAEESPLRALRDAGLKHENLRLAPEERYSFVFENRFGSLDHAFATPSLDEQVTGFTEWHVNSDEPETLSYNKVSPIGFVSSPYRASDHDPLLIGLQLKSDATVASAVPTPGTPKPLAATKPKPAAPKAAAKTAAKKK